MKEEVIRPAFFSSFIPQPSSLPPICGDEFPCYTWQTMTAAAQGRGFHVLTKPIGPICNLDCKYCFYLEKEKLYPAEHNWRMSDAVLDAYVRQYIEAQPPDAPEIGFAWQGGEPTLLGVDFFRKVVELQRRYS